MRELCPGKQWVLRGLRPNLLILNKGAIPSDTNSLLTQNNSEMIILDKLRTSRVISVKKKSFFPGDSEGANSLKLFEKLVLTELIL